MNSPADCELLAGLAATKGGVEYTAQTVGGVGTGVAPARHARQFRVHPDAIKKLAVGEAFLVNKNNGMITYMKTRKSEL